MNYFAHAHRFLVRGDSRPEFLAGTAVPDWLSVADRRVRCRARSAEPFVDIDDEPLAALARGILQHHADDAWFHSTRAFTELSLDFSRRVRDRQGGKGDLRSGFLGHIMVELLMDRVLMLREPELLDQYYELLRTVDEQFVASSVSRMSGQDASRLAEWITRFCGIQFLRDYTDDALLAFRVNQVLSRVRLEPLSGELIELLPGMHASVDERIDELLPAE